MREVIWTDLPVVICPYMPAAEIPIPCCPRLMRNRWNLDPYRSFAKIFGICWRTMPGPLSETVIRKRLAWGGGAGGLVFAGELVFAGGLVFSGGLLFEGFSFRPRFAEGAFFAGFRIWRAPISTAVTADFGCGAGGLVFAGGLVSAAGLPFEGLSFWPRFAGGAFFDGFRLCCAPISTAVTPRLCCGGRELALARGSVFA